MPTQQASMMRQLQDSSRLTNHQHIRSHIVNKNCRTTSKMPSQAPLPPPPPPPSQPPPSSQARDLKQVIVTSAGNPAPPPPPPPPKGPFGATMINNITDYNNKGSHNAINMNCDPSPAINKTTKLTPQNQKVNAVGKAAPDIGALLSQIQQGKTLRKTSITRDASRPLVTGKVAPAANEASQDHSTRKIPNSNGVMMTPGSDLASQLKNKFNSMNTAKNIKLQRDQQQKNVSPSITETNPKGNNITVNTYCDAISSSSPTKPPTPPKHATLAYPANLAKNQSTSNFENLNGNSDANLQTSPAITQVNGLSCTKSTNKKASDSASNIKVNNSDSYQIIKASTTTVTTNQLLLAKARRDSIHSVSTSSTSSLNHIGSDVNMGSIKLALPNISLNQVVTPVNINKNRSEAVSLKSSSTIKTAAPMPPPRTQSCVRPSVGPPPPPVPSIPPVPPTRNSSISKMANNTVNLAKANVGLKFSSQFESLFKPVSQLPKPEPYRNCPKIYPSHKAHPKCP